MRACSLRSVLVSSSLLFAGGCGGGGSLASGGGGGPNGPSAQEAYVKASNTGGGDRFGDAVSISGDTMVVGAYGESSGARGVGGNQSDDSAAASGAVYVFVRTGATWTQQAYLKASNADPDDEFGRAVAISGDTIVVGAAGEDWFDFLGNGTDYPQSGAAYVFVRSGTTWTQQAYLKASNTGAGDLFGESVSVSGNTIVVGASGEDGGATGVNGNPIDDSAPDSGAAYVFVRAGSTWTQQSYLKASNTDAGDAFGASVAVSGDTIVVGAMSEASSATGVGGNQADDSAAGCGAAYVFQRSGTTWTQAAYLKASNADGGDGFGSGVAVSGDVLVVGAFQEASRATGLGGDEADDSVPFSGATYVFGRSGSSWIQLTYVKASNTGFGDDFGGAVAISGDTIVVGALGERGGATGINGDETAEAVPDSGAAYVFR